MAFAMERTVVELFIADKNGKEGNLLSCPRKISNEGQMQAVNINVYDSSTFLTVMSFAAQ